jgi:taurine dioxygenase
MQVGAEIVGLTEANEFDEQTQEDLYATWMEYGLLLFRNITTIEHHIELSRCFGELELHPIPSMRAKEDPLFMTVGGEDASALVYDETDLKVNTIAWHRDTAYTADIAKGAMLRMLVTLFADTARAYSDLPEAMKTRIANLEWRSTLHDATEQPLPSALWKTVRPMTAAEATRVGRAQEKSPPRSIPDFPSVVHPAVLVHPESRRTCLFLSPKEFDFFLGMERAESDELFAYLASHSLQDRYVYRHVWTVNDAMLWDNRRFMHAAAGNPVGQPRKGLRTTLAGELRIGRLYAEAAAAD